MDGLGFHVRVGYLEVHRCEVDAFVDKEQESTTFVLASVRPDGGELGYIKLGFFGELCFLESSYHNIVLCDPF